jgi:hypothetical protein
MFHRVYDNLIPATVMETIAREIQDVNIDWHWKPDTIGKTFEFTNDKIVETPQFIHTIWPENSTSPHKLLPLIKGVINAVVRASGLDVFRMNRIKANLIPQHAAYDASWYHTPHCDLSIEKELASDDLRGKFALSLIYYPLDCDGVTRIFDTFLSNFDTSADCADAIQSARCTDEIAAKQGRCVLLPSSLLHASSPPRKSQRRMVINTVFFSNRGLDPKLNVKAE